MQLGYNYNNNTPRDHHSLHKKASHRRSRTQAHKRGLSQYIFSTFQDDPDDINNDDGHNHNHNKEYSFDFQDIDPEVSDDLQHSSSSIANLVVPEITQNDRSDRPPPQQHQQLQPIPRSIFKTLNVEHRNPIAPVISDADIPQAFLSKRSLRRKSSRGTTPNNNNNLDILHPSSSPASSTSPSHSSAYDEQRLLDSILGSDLGFLIEQWTDLSGDSSSYELPVDSTIDAVQSLSSTVLDALGPPLKFVRADITDVLHILRDVATKFGVATLQRACIAEGFAGEASEGLLYLKRCLSFVYLMLMIFTEGSSTLKPAVNEAYNNTLNYLHTSVTRMFTKPNVAKLPHDEAFLRRLNKNTQLALDALVLLLRVLRPTMVVLVDFCNKNDLEHIQALKQEPPMPPIVFPSTLQINNAKQLSPDPQQVLSSAPTKNRRHYRSSTLDYLHSKVSDYFYSFNKTKNTQQLGLSTPAPNTTTTTMETTVVAPVASSKTSTTKKSGHHKRSSTLDIMHSKLSDYFPSIFAPPEQLINVDAIPNVDDDFTNEPPSKSIVNALDCETSIPMSHKLSTRLSSTFSMSLDPTQNLASRMLEEQVRDTLHTLAKNEGNQFYSIIDQWDKVNISTAHQEIQAIEFVDAIQALLIVVDALGPAMKFVRSDIYGNLVKTRDAATRTGAGTLQRICLIEKFRGKATEALLWLKRTLSFIEVFLMAFIQGASTGDAQDFAYKTTLFHAHNPIVRMIAGNVRYTLPPREVFLTRLHPDHQIVLDGIVLFIRIFRPRLKVLVSFFNHHQLENIDPLKQVPSATPVYFSSEAKNVVDIEPALENEKIESLNILSKEVANKSRIKMVSRILHVVVLWFCLRKRNV